MLKYLKIIYSYILYEFSKRNRDIVVFSGYNNMKYNFNSKYLFEYFINNHSEIEAYFVINDSSLRNKLNKEIGPYFITTNKIRDLKLLFFAFTWITSGGLPIRIPYVNRNRVVVNLWHGLPFKGIGLLNKENTFIQNILIRFIYSNYDLIACTSELFQQIMSKSFAVDINHVKILGQAWNDQLWNKNDKFSILSNIYGDKLPSFEKVFLYAPTWRNGRSTEFFPFEKFSIDELEYKLEIDQMIICLRTHQLDVNAMKKYSVCKRVLLMNEDKVVDIMSIINIFDGLISDYSGIIFDYLLLDRPIILIPYDKECYISERNVNFDFSLFEFNIIPRYQSDFFEQLDLVKQNYIPSKKQIRFKSIVHYYMDDLSCFRHYNEIINLIESKYKM